MLPKLPYTILWTVECQHSQDAWTLLAWQLTDGVKPTQLLFLGMM